MSKGSGNFFEKHIEKIVLAAVGLVCIWLLVTRVLISPNKVVYAGQKFGPSEIDNHISDRAGRLGQMLSGAAEHKQAYDPCLPSLVSLFKSAIDIKIGLNPLQPPHISSRVSDDREYRMPLIGKVSDVSVEYIGAVAYVPTADVDEQNAYDEAKSEPGDIDFVTVEAKFDIAGLVENFRECFAGEDIPEEWRDPCLAKPIFAAVQLQRQELLGGGWSDWENVPRTKINPGKKMFEVAEAVGKLPPGGVERHLLEFDDGRVRMDLLQPEAYRIASAEEEWFPPSLHKEYVKYQQKEEVRERREAREAEKKEKESKREEKLRRREPGFFGAREGGLSGDSTVRGSEPRTRGGWGGYDRTAFTRRREPHKKVSSVRSKEASKATSIDDIYDKLNELLITEKTDISRVREPLVFWTHDDTVEPEKSYRYRIRLGVFNPIAGTNQFREQEESRKNEVILWSEFSATTQTVAIPGRLYFFPLQDAAKVVTVQVFRYVLGYWYSRNFAVKRGEVIGKVVEHEHEVQETAEAKEGITVPETIDYATGAVLVDVVHMNDWLGGGGKNLRPRYYSDMLYSFDGTSIAHMPIKLSYWPGELRTTFREVEKAEKKPRKPFRPFGSRMAGRKRVSRPRTEKTEVTDKSERGGREEESEMEAFRQMMESRGGR